MGIDCGSQGTKAILIDSDTGQIHGRGFKSYGMIEGLDVGHKEQHPSTWIDALIESVKATLLEAKIETSQIRGIGVSGQQHGLIPLDGKGAVIRPAKLWNDTSTVNECKYILDQLGGVQKSVKLVGNNILPGFTAGKILWLKRHEPENYNRMVRILLPHDYINFWLTGKTTMEPVDASGTALMDIKSRKWCNEVINVIDHRLKDILPKIFPSYQCAGFLRKEAADSLGIPEGTLVSAGGGDNMMGAIGTGNTKPGVVTVSLGTSGTIYSYSSTPAVDMKGEAHGFCDSTGGWLPLICTMNVTVATELARHLLRLNYEELERVIQSVPPGAGGLVLLPYLTGERTPNVPDGKGIFYGLNEDTFSAPYIARSSMEGVTMGLNYGFKRLIEMGVEPIEVRLTGGGARNKAWRRIAADVFNVNVVCLSEEEGAAYGAALQSIWTYKKELGEETTITDITDKYVRLDESTRIEPIPTNVKVYEKLQNIQNELSERVRPLFKLSSS